MAKMDLDEIKDGCKRKFTAVIFLAIVIFVLEAILVINIELIERLDPECANDGDCQNQGLDKCAFYFNHRYKMGLQACVAKNQCLRTYAVGELDHISEKHL